MIQIAGTNLILYGIIAFLSGKKEFNSCRYYFSLRICYIILIATACYIIIKSMMKYFGSIKVCSRCFLITFWSLAIIFGIFDAGNVKDYIKFSLVSWSELNNIENELKKVSAEKVIIFTDCSLPVSLAHNDWEAYFFRSYDEIEEVNKEIFNGSVYYYKNKENIYQTTFNQVFAGKRRDVERIINSVENIDSTYVVFWRANLSGVGEEMSGFYNTTDLIIDSKPINLGNFKKEWNEYFNNS